MLSMEWKRQQYMQQEMEQLRRRHPLFNLKIQPFEQTPMKFTVSLPKNRKIQQPIHPRSVKYQVQPPIKLAYRPPQQPRKKRRQANSQYVLPPLNPQVMQAFSEGNSIHFEFNTKNRFYVRHNDKKSRSKYEQAYARFSRASRNTQHRLKTLQEMVTSVKQPYPSNTSIDIERHHATEPTQKQFHFHEDDIEQLSGLKNPTLKAMLRSQIRQLRQFFDKNDS